jgi:hypothetical protein
MIETIERADNLTIIGPFIAILMFNGMLNALPHFLFSHDLLQGPNIRGITAAHNGNANHCADISDMSLKCIGIFLYCFGAGAYPFLDEISLIFRTIRIGRLYGYTFLNNPLRLFLCRLHSHWTDTCLPIENNRQNSKR